MNGDYLKEKDSFNFLKYFINNLLNLINYFNTIKLISFLFKYKYLFIYFYKINLIGDWGLGIGDWGLGIGPNPQSPIPNPQLY